jgi:ribonuclease D
MNSLPIEIEAVAPPPYTFVTTEDGFHEMLEHLMASSRLAIDIEADSLYHYFEKVCLIQISTDSNTYILDPLAIRNVNELAPLMCNPSVEKVFHAAGYDTYCLRRDYDFAFVNIFDTHIAAQLLGYEFLGLSTLMEEFLGVHHSKRRQRDDWSRRPLDLEQLNYAAMDTHHLLQIRDLLEAELRLKGRLGWAQEEFATAASAERREKEFDPEGFRRIKGNRDLSLQDQVVLRALFLFRDEVARKMDVPPFKVLNNSVLLDLAHRPPVSPEELNGRSGVSSRVARKYSARIVSIISEARKQDVSILEAPQRNNWKSPGRAAKLLLEMLRLWRNEKAKELSLQIGVVFPASLLEHVAATPPADMGELAALPMMRQWRVQEFGAELLQLLRNGESQETGDATLFPPL